MEKDSLEYYLERGNSFGLNLASATNSVSWLLLSKRKPVSGFFERFNETDTGEIFSEQKKVRDEPYQIWVAEISKEIFDGDDFPKSEDYISNKSFSFSSLDKVETFLYSMKLSFFDLKWSAEVDFL